MKRIAFIECEGGCDFGVEFKHPNNVFFYCTRHSFGVNVPDSELSRDQICRPCGTKMERYDLEDEDNICPICERNVLSICYTDENEELEVGSTYLRNTPGIWKAICKAVTLHKDQYRKGNERKEPFVLHVISVGEILAQHTDDEEIIIAGILHDSIEDGREDGGRYAPEKLKEEFGQRVHDIVMDVTEDMELKVNPNSRATWKERKLRYIDHLHRASHEGLLVSCADKIHNLRSLYLSLAEDREDVWGRFNAPKEEIKWYYGAILDYLRARLDGAMIEDYEEIFKRIWPDETAAKGMSTEHRLLSKEEEERFMYTLDRAYLIQLDFLKKLKLLPPDSLTMLELTKRKRYDKKN